MARVAIKKLRSLDKRLLLQRQREVQKDGSGAPYTEWVNDATVWAEIKPEPFFGRYAETLAAMGLQVQQDKIIGLRIRHRPEVDTTWRGMIGTRLLEFLNVANFQEDNSFMVILAREIVGG